MRSLAPLLTSCAVAPDVPPASGSDEVFELADTVPVLTAGFAGLSERLVSPEAALDAVRASRFTPGERRGRPIRVRLALPVAFRLGDAATGNG